MRIWSIVILINHYHFVSSTWLHENTNNGIDKYGKEYETNAEVNKENIKSCAGKRIRKEIRRMSPEEWKAFTSAVNALKENGDYDKLAAVHRGKQRIESTHFGPGFLGWHRVFLLCVESLLRKIDPCVTIPYWDSTLDHAMDKPQKSVLWTEQFFGNGYDNVTTGPFKNWVTGQGQNLTRFVENGEGELFSPTKVNSVLSHRNHSEFTVFKDSPFSIEFGHNLLHSWVGGQMGCFPSAAEDPAFWTVHCYIDCLWEKFRKKILRKYGIHAADDYPGVKGKHAADKLMEPFTSIPPFLGFTNNDGYMDDLKIYECEDFPTCSIYDPDCKSPYLYCDTKRGQCVSIEGNQDVDKNGESSSLPFGPYASVEEACAVQSGTVKTKVFQAMDFPVEHLPKLDRK